MTRWTYSAGTVTADPSAVPLRTPRLTQETSPGR